MVIFGVIYCVVLLAILGVFFYLRLQTKSFIKIGTYYSSQFFNCEITLEEYKRLKDELLQGASPLLKWYMRKVGAIID